MDRVIKRHRQKIVYLLIGGWNTLFGYGVFVLLYNAFSKFVGYAVVLTVSYVVSITNSYIGYKLFVFKTRGNFLREYLKFYVVYGGGYMLNLLMFPVFTGFIGVNPYYAQILITFIIMVASYMSHKKFSFR